MARPQRRRRRGPGPLTCNSLEQIWNRARVVRAGRVMHGKRSDITHDGTGLFDGLPTPLSVMRYHSLVVERASLPPSLEILAVATDDPAEIHAVRHREHPVWGVQFHPESILTTGGKTILRNFLALAG